ncbi:MAG: RNA polymerase sigma factor [Bacteroidota bacterium]|jgi:RNA polymerase sigma factor (sigma-70 family)
MQTKHKSAINEANHQDDTTLFQEFRKGDTEAFSHFYDTYVNVLYHFGSKITNDKELLKDCIHDVFIKIYNKRQDLSDIQDIKSYLFSTLRNKILDEIRRKAYFTEKEIESYQVASSENVEKEYLLKEKEDYDNVKVAFFMTKLSHRQREAITLYFIEEKKYDEICTLMDINYQSLRNLIHRSLTKLRSQLL